MATSFHTINENNIIKILNAKKQGRGADAIDPAGVPFEVRESKKTPKFRLQKDVHEHLVKNKGYYILKRGKDVLKIDADEVTKLLKKGDWNKDRYYPYKYLYCKDVMMMNGGGVVEDIQKNQISLVDWFADFFATQ